MIPDSHNLEYQIIPQERLQEIDILKKNIIHTKFTDIKKDYKFLTKHCLGEGGFGTVYKALLRESLKKEREEFKAIKKFKYKKDRKILDFEEHGSVYIGDLQGVHIF